MSCAATLGPLEREVMDVLWKKKSVCVREVAAELSATHSLAYTTVLTILSRLWKKGMVERTKTGKSFIYKPTVDRQQTVQSLIKSTIKSMVECYGDEAVSALIDEVNSMREKRNLRG